VDAPKRKKERGPRCGGRVREETGQTRPSLGGEESLAMRTKQEKGGREENSFFFFSNHFPIPFQNNLNSFWILTKPLNQNKSNASRCMLKHVSIL